MDRHAASLTVDAAGQVSCGCGRRIYDHLAERTQVTVERQPFRRVTDHVVCDRCHDSYPMAEIVAAVSAATVDRPDLS